MNPAANSNPGRIIAALILGWCLVGSVFADQTDQRLNGLFTSLAGAVDARDAVQLEAKIWSIWAQTGQPNLEVLYERGRAAMESGRFDSAVRLFSALIAAQPNFAEAWNKRATVYYLQHKLAESVVDIEHTLALEPRHFGALSGLGLIFMARDDALGALQAFERVLKINPQSVAARSNVKWLRRQLDIHGA